MSEDAAAAAVTFDLTYWVSAQHRLTLGAADVEAKLRAAGLADAVGIAGRIARGEITDADAREDQDGLTGDDEDLRFLARTLSGHAGLFGAGEPSGPPTDWDDPDDYHVWVSPDPDPQQPPARPEAGGEAASTTAPAAVRAAIARVVAYNWDDEERDYGECGPGPGQNSRQGHVYEDLVLIRRWIGSCDGLPR